MLKWFEFLPENENKKKYKWETMSKTFTTFYYQNLYSAEICDGRHA